MVLERRAISPLERYSDPFDLRLRHIFGGADIEFARLTSSEFRTAPSDPKVILDADGLRFIDGSGAVVVNLDTATASASFSGKLTAGTITGTFEFLGGKFVTSPTGARVEFGDSGLEIYDATGVTVELDENGLRFQTGVDELASDAISWFRRNTGDASPFALITSAHGVSFTRMRHRLDPRTASEAAGSRIELDVTDEAPNSRASIHVTGASVAGVTEAINMRVFTAAGTQRGQMKITRNDVLMDVASSGARGFLKAFAAQQASQYFLLANGLLRLGGDSSVGAGLVYPSAPLTTYAPDIAADTSVSNVAISYAIAFPVGVVPTPMHTVRTWVGHGRVLLAGEGSSEGRTGCEVTISNVHPSSTLTSVDIFTLPVVR